MSYESALEKVFDSLDTASISQAGSAESHLSPGSIPFTMTAEADIICISLIHQAVLAT